MKRILFIGNANSFLLRQLIKWIEKKSDISVEIIHTLNTRVKNPEDYYRVYSFHIPDLIIRLPYIGRYCRTRQINRLLRNIPGRFCCAHIHEIKRIYAGILPDLRQKAEKVILTVWGSDFNLVSDTIKKQLVPLFRQADTITFANTILKDNFLDYYFNIDQKKIRVIKFGLNPLETIKNTTKNTGWIKKHFHLPPDRIVVTIGYNGRDNQQHMLIINSLMNNRKLIEKSKEIILLFPMTYGGSASYIQKISEKLKKTPFDYIIYRDILSEEEVAWLRMSSDIMIQLQRKDQFSGSMQEYLYAGNVVITGKWLPYEELKSMGIYMIEVNDPGEIGDSLNKVLDHLSGEKKKSMGNKEIIYSVSSWDKNIGNWLSLY